jgi:hypothetical protein
MGEFANARLTKALAIAATGFVCLLSAILPLAIAGLPIPLCRRLNTPGGTLAASLAQRRRSKTAAGLQPTDHLNLRLPSIAEPQSAARCVRRPHSPNCDGARDGKTHQRPVGTPRSPAYRKAKDSLSRSGSAFS